MTASIAIPARRDAGLTIALCFIAALAEGFDIQSMGVAAPTMAPALGLARDQLGWAFSASTIGLLFGAIALGRLADHVGRRVTLIASLAIFGTFSLATTLAWDFTSLIAIRFLAGLGLGGAMPNMIALAAEAVDEQIRPRVVMAMGSGMPFGGAVASAIAAGLDWRVIFEVGGGAPLIVALIMAPLLPESAAFLAARGAASGAGRQADFLNVLFGGGRALPTLLLWTGAFSLLLTLFMLLNWLPILMGAKGVSKPAASLVSVLFNTGGGAGALGLAVLFFGPRRGWTLALWFVGMASALVALAFTGSAFASAGAAGLAAGVFVAGAPLALYALAPDYYPVEMRGAGVGATVGVSRFGAILGPFLAGALLAHGENARAVLLAVLPFVGLAAAAVMPLIARRPAA
jgi:AAHS family 3-hydroxyphenylpropionic acid transporter